MNPGPVCSGCTGTIRVGSHPTRMVPVHPLCSLSIVFTVHCVHCPLCSLSIVFSVHCVHCPLCSLFIVLTVHCVHCPLCSLSIVFTVHCVHCPFCSLSVVFTVHCVHCPLCSLSIVFAVRCVHCQLCSLSIVLICTQCQRLLHGYCNGLTRDQQKSPQGYVCGACGSTNGSTIQPSQITRSQPNNTFFCQTNIAVSNYPCSRLPQQILIPLQRHSTDHPNTEPTTPAEPSRVTTVRKCPECKICLAQVRSPLVCVACRQQFHVKCARETQLAQQRLRAADAWICHLCASVQRATNQPAAVDCKTDMPEQNKHCLTILQWNCDCLTTKVVELSELTVRYGIDITALQETKLGRDDPTPVLNGFDAVRRYRPRSGARFARGGGLLTYITKGIPYSEVPAAQQGPLEKLHVIIPTTRRQHLTIANAYFPPASSNYVQPMEDRQTWVDTLEAWGPPSSAVISMLIMCPGTSMPKACPALRCSTIGSKKMRWRCSMTANQQELPGSSKCAV